MSALLAHIITNVVFDVIFFLLGYQYATNGAQR